MKKPKQEKITEETTFFSEPEFDYSKEYTYADYLKFPFEEMVELIRGKVFKMSPAPRSVHQVVTGNIYGHLWSYL